MLNSYLLLMLFSIYLATSHETPTELDESFGDYWRMLGEIRIQAALDLPKIESTAKNIILFLGDGMGLPTVTATRIYKGQKNGNSGMEESLAFDDFPYTSLSKTHGLDRIVSDSSNTATAYLCGVKANHLTLGLDGRVKANDCEASLDVSTHVDSILKWAQDTGKSTGFVTTASVTDASVAGLYAHSPNRFWQSSTPEPLCEDIAYQLVHRNPGKDINVILGGGVKNFIPSNWLDVNGNRGARKDKRSLLHEWYKDKSERNLTSKIVLTAEEMKSLDLDNTDYLLGLFAPDLLPFVLDRPQLKTAYPTLAEMTQTALNILSKNPEGYFLMVEGGNIDKAHHLNWAHKALEEGIDFEEAIHVALQKTDEKDTLLVVTADHSQTFTLGGDAIRGASKGTNILGFDGVSDIDHEPYTILGYFTGPGYRNRTSVSNVTEESVFDKDFRYPSAVPKSIGTHGGEDVAVYAKGPMAHLYHGVHDQSYIPYVMGYAACIGPNRQKCKDRT